MNNPPIPQREILSAINAGHFDVCITRFWPFPSFLLWEDHKENVRYSFRIFITKRIIKVSYMKEWYNGEGGYNKKKFYTLKEPAMRELYNALIKRKNICKDKTDKEHNKQKHENMNQLKQQMIQAVYKKI